MIDFNSLLKKIEEIGEISNKWEQELQNGITKEIVKIFPQPVIDKSKDLYFNLYLSWKDADRGCKKEIRIYRLEYTTSGELVRVNRMLMLTIPKGQGCQSILKLKEHGNACKDGGKPGDLFIVLVIPEDDKDWKYNELNNDIFTNVKIASDNFNRDLSKMFCLNTEILEVEHF